MAKAKKPKESPERQAISKQIEGTRLTVELSELIMARLRILAEDSDPATVLSDAVRLLWEHRYPKAAAVPPKPKPSKTIAVQATPEEQKHTTVHELHAKGIPMEDIAAELDWSLEAVRLVLGIGDEQPSALVEEVSERETLRQRVRALREEGLSYGRIAKQLNAERVPTLSGSGRWHQTTVRRLLGV